MELTIGILTNMNEVYYLLIIIYIALFESYYPKIYEKYTSIFIIAPLLPYTPQ